MQGQKGANEVAEFKIEEVENTTEKEKTINEIRNKYGLSQIEGGNCVVTNKSDNKKHLDQKYRSTQLMVGTSYREWYKHLESQS